MFYYISFLRPPPPVSPLYGNISITPQIANDLRTEPFDGAQDVFYAWSLCHGPTFTKPIKLTTWRQSSAYKEISVPLPPGVRNGQSWVLLLCSQAHGQAHTIALAEDVGQAPFPVMSMPILFQSRSDPRLAKGKQEKIERVFRFSGRLSDGGESEQQVEMKITEQTSFDLDKVSAFPVFLIHP